MAYHLHGKAIFSTHNGEYARREKTPSMRIILRSNPVEDQQAMVSKLQKAFPEACKAITRPVMDMDVYEYFDYCDAEVQGFEFLRAVLDYIARLNENVIAEKALKIQDYVRRWKTANSEAFRYIRPYHAITDLFTEEDIEEQGIELLTEAMMQIKVLRMQEDNDQARQSALRLQMQHAQTMQNRRNFTPLPAAPAPARPLFTIDASAKSMRAKTNPRASSNPESSLSQSQGGPFRRLPGSPGQISAPQSHLPLQRLTPSTEVLEHIHPGSTSRGDFHSDPTAHNAMDSDASAPPDNYIVIPSRGLPGPFTYRPLPSTTQPVPLLNRVGTFDGNLPKGKKNPQKKSSDDARIVSNSGNGPLEASHGANNQRPLTLQNAPPPFYSQSPEAIPLAPEFHPDSAAVPYSGNFQVNLPQSRISGDRLETVGHPPHSGQIPMQPAMGGRLRELTNPYAQPAHELQGPMQDPRPTMLTLSIPPNLQHQETTAKGHLFEEHSGFLSTQARPRFPQPLEPHAFGYQLPDCRIEAEDRRTPDLENQRPALASTSNAGQSPTSGISGRSLANETPRRSVPEGCTIWIGGLPQEFDRAAVTHLLEPCRGLVYVSEPRVSTTSRDLMKRSYVFADFQNSVDAIEARERLPQTQFASLPDGTFLSTGYPRLQVISSPRHQKRGGERQRKWPGSNISPSKSRTGEDPARAGKPKRELGGNSSKGSARGKKASVSSFDGDSRRPSERVIAVDAGQKASDQQPQEAFTSTSLLPHGRAGSMVLVSQPSADGQQGSKPVIQDPTVVQPDVGVEPHANDGSKATGDGGQEITSAPATKPQVQDNHQGPDKRPEGHTKTSKKKSKGSNRLPEPETKGSEPHLVNAGSTVSKPTKSAKLFANINKVPNSHSEAKGKQSTSEIEASNMIAPKIPLDPAPILPKDLETPDQSFLDCNPTEVDGEHPKASVAYVAIHSNAKDDEAKVSHIAPVSRDPSVLAALLKQPEDSMSEAMRGDNSNSAQGSADTMFILRSTAPPSSPQTVGSNSIPEETLSSTFQASNPSSESAQAFGVSGRGETASDGKAETPKGPAPPGTGLETSRVHEGLTNLTNRESVELRPSLIKVDLEKGPNLPLIQPSPSKPKQELPRSPVRKRAPSIPPRSSSLAVPSTPIKTHRKKKPRIHTPVGEAPSEDHLGCLTKVTFDGTKTVPNKQAMGSTKITQPSLTIDPAACALTAEKLKGLPKPETPFLMDDGVRVTPLMINRHTVTEASNAKWYYELKRTYQVSHLGSTHLGSATHVGATSNVIGSPDSTSPQSSDMSTPDRASVKKQTNDLEKTLREAGFRSLSDSSPFPIKTPELAFFEVIEGEGTSLQNCSNKDGPMVSWIDDSGKLGPGMSLDALMKQNEIMEVVKKAAAVKRLLAGPPPWTKIESQRQQLSRWITHFVTSPQEQQTVKPKAHRTFLAKSLLDTIPGRDSSTTELQKWSTKVSRFMEENPSGSSPTYGQSRKRATNSPSKSTRSTPLRQEQQERRHRVLINKPDPQVLARGPSRDDFTLQSVDTELSDTLTTGQITESELSPSTFGRRTPSEERPTKPLGLVPFAAFNQVSKLDDLFVGMGKEQRRWSDDCQRFSTPQEDERMTKSDHGIKPLDAEFDVLRVTEVDNVEPESETNDMDNEVRQTPHEEKQSVSTSKELAGEDGKGDQNIPAKSDGSKDHTPAKSKQDAPAEAENPNHQKNTPQPLGASFSSFDSSVTTSNEGSSAEAHRDQPRGGHSLLGRSGYNAVAGRGTDAKRGKEKDGSQDPWALPQGEKPWGRGGKGGGKGRGEKKRRQRQ